jgi:hypothetical protein
MCNRYPSDSLLVFAVNDWTKKEKGGFKDKEIIPQKKNILTSQVINIASAL